MHRIAVGAFAGFAALAGCLGEQTKTCANGATCPFDEACTEVPIDSGKQLCGVPRLVEECRGKAEFDACTFIRGEDEAEVPGACNSNICIECSFDVAGCTFDGWHPMRSGVTSRLEAVWAFARDHAYAVGDENTLLYYDGIAWRRLDTGIPDAGRLTGIWAADPGNLYVTTSDGRVLHGVAVKPGELAWSVVAQVQASFGLLEGIHGLGPDNIVAVGEAVGEGAVALEFDGATWTQTTVPGDNLLNGVLVADAQTTWAVGEQGVIVRRESGSWSSSRMGAANLPHLHTVALAGGLFAAGDKVPTTAEDPTILQLQGSWGPAPGIEPLQPFDVAMFWSNGTLLYAVGEAGAIVRYDGATWAPEPTASTQTLFGVSGVPGSVIAVGAGGTIVRKTEP